MSSGRRAPAVDLALCAAILAYGLPPALDPGINNPSAVVVGPLLLPLLVVPVLVRRARPLTAAAAFLGACVLSGVPTFDQLRFIVAVPAGLLVVAAVARRCSWRSAVVGPVVVLAGLCFVGATDALLAENGGLGALAVFAVPLAVAVWGGGRLVWSRERVAERLQERTDLLRRQREASAALAVDIDRERLAADLDHAARSRLEEMVALASANEDDERAGRARFARIELLGRESLDEMRTLLGLLRSTDPGARSPRPTLEDLDELLAGARAGGRVVDLEVEGERRALAAVVELGAFRVVQHALGVLDGGSDRPAAVAVRYLPDRLEVEVRGERSPTAGAQAALMAARERVVTLGGTFATGGRDGHVLLAALPVHG